MFLYMYEQSLPKLVGGVMATSPHSQLDVGVDGHEREQQVRRQLLIPQDLFKPTIPSHAQMKGRTTQNSSRRNTGQRKPTLLTKRHDNLHAEFAQSAVSAHHRASEHTCTRTNRGGASSHVNKIELTEESQVEDPFHTTDHP